MSQGQKPSTIRIGKPKYVPHLQFEPKSDLKKLGLWLLLWSENDSDHKILLDLLKNNEFFHLFSFGETGSGKSNLIEVFAEYYYKTHGKLIIDASGNDFEGCYWAKNYPCYFVYPQLLKAAKKNQNPNVIEIKLNHKNPWGKIIQKAWKYKKVIVLMCEDPLEPSYLRMLRGLFDALLKSKFAHIEKICLLREISFFAYQHGTLKLSDKKIVTDLKRKFMKYIRVGRNRNNEIMCYAERLGDIDKSVGENVAVKAIKRTDGFVDNFDKYMQETVKTLKKEQVLFKVLGKICTGTIALSSFHKEPGESIQEVLKVFPKQVELSHFNKLVENRYIDRVSEYYTNRLDRIILGRRRHLQDPENSELCQFEIADLLALECKIHVNKKFTLNKIKIIYGEIKFRSANSSHPRIETSDVKKTVQDLAVKRINWDIDKNIYFWTIDKVLANSLGWAMEDEERKVACIVEMICPQGASKGAMALMKKHHIYNRVIKINEGSFFD